MRVEIDEVLFADLSHSSMLASVARLAWEERHRVFIVEDGSSAFKAWLSAHPVTTTEEWELIADLSVRSEALEPSSLSILLTNTEASDWAPSQPYVTLEDGVSLLRRPFEVLMENARNDSAFLMRLASPQQRKALRSLEDRHWLRFNGAGGIGEMKKLLQGNPYQQPQSRFITWVMHDSDALRPGEPSAEAMKITEICADLRIGHFMLSRRAIENYMPLPSLEAWAQRMPHERLALYRAYARLSPDERAHYNCKSGLEGDRARTADATPLFSLISAKDLAALSGGFGTTIAEMYRDEAAVEDSHEDDSRTEVQLAIAQLLGCLN